MSRTSTLLMATLAACVVLTPLRAQAQWWSSKPADFESCADIAEKAATKEEKASKLGDCHSQFAGRRKPGGGYTYFDFMQNRHFDIAGPNLTPEEQKKIDEEYIAYLERERRSTIAAAFTARQRQVQQASLKSEVEKVPVPRQNPARQQAAVTSESKSGESKSAESRSGDLRSRTRATNCAKDSFSCEWPRLSESIKDIKKLFNPSPSKPKRS
jgi:DNA-binding helix-hairpin-helix protein with protein kinase domain